MRKKTIMTSMALLMFLWVYTPVLSAQVVQLARSDYLVFAGLAGPESVDPAWAYDTASLTLISNVYDTLIRFEVDRSLDPKAQGLLDQFMPGLAKSWTVEDVNIYDPVVDETWLQAFTFEIRFEDPATYWFEGAMWHDCEIIDWDSEGKPVYDTVKTWDVEYSFERWILQDRAGGNVWLILSSILGVSKVPHPPDATEAEAELFAHKIDRAIQSNLTHVRIYRNTRKLPGVFLQTIAQGWASILDYDWCVDLGDFPGFAVTGYTYGGWQAWHDPAISPIDAAGHPMMGTGPYMLDYLIMDVEWSIVAHEGVCYYYDLVTFWVYSYGYWGEWPADFHRGGTSPACTPPCLAYGYFERIKFEIVEEWTFRKAGFLDGIYDMVYVPRPSIPELVVSWGPPEQYLEGITCFQPLPVLAEQNIFFNYNVSTASLWCGPGFNPAAPYTWGDDRIPINFFDDVNVRKAFALIWDAPTYINWVLLGEAIMPASHHVYGLAYYNPTPEGNYGGTGPAGENTPVWAAPTGTGPYPYLEADELPAGSVWSGYPNQGDPYGAEYYLKMAWGGTDPNNDGVVEPGDEGSVWTNGFRFTLTYVAGVDEWAMAADMMKTMVENAHPMAGHFNVDVVALEFDTEFLPEQFARRLTMFIRGWQADFADPHDGAHAYMHTEGTLFWCQSGEAMTGVNDIIDIPEIGWLGTSDQLIEDASYELDTTRREAMYHKLQEVFHDRVINIPISQETGRHWERTWVKGWYFNPLFGGPLQHTGESGLHGLYFYHYYNRFAADIDYKTDEFGNKVVDMLDKWMLDANWGPPPLFDPETAQNYRADINNDGRVSIQDKGIMSYYQLGIEYTEYAPDPP